LVCRGQELRGFAVAGDNGKFVWAQARNEGDSVRVWSPSVPEPKAVRYAWADNPVCTLYGATGLPAAPFRSDAET
jgi:sialate O-acetylesterase